MAINSSKREGFTMIPNAIIDNPNLCLRDKMVLIKLKSHAYGDKNDAYPSQVKIAKDLKIRRETAKEALDSLTGLGVIRPHGKGRKGKRETYTLDLDLAANLTSESARNMAVNPSGNLTTHPAAPDGSSGINKTAEENELKKKTDGSEVTSTIEVPVERGVIHGTAVMLCFPKTKDLTAQ